MKRMRGLRVAGLAIVTAMLASCVSSAPTPVAVGSAQAQSGSPATAAVSPAVPATTPAATASQDPGERFADDLATALEASDYDRLRGLISPRGWVFALNGSEGSQPLTPDDTISRLRKGTTDGRLRVQVQRRPLLPRTSSLPPGDVYLRSMWLQFDGHDQQVDVVLRNESGTWYWSGALFGATQ
jgi:hypothetical protein